MSNQFKKHFVFDFDDTLVDGRTFCGESMARAINKFHPEVNPDLVVAFHETIRGATIVDLYKMAIEEFELTCDLQGLLDEDKRIQMTESCKMKSFTGVHEILEFLKSKGKKLHICTNRTKETLIPILKENHLFEFYDSIVSCADEGFKKPDPTCLKRIIEESGDNMEDFIYFGDSEVDRDFALNSGIEYIIFDQYLNNKDLFKKLLNMFLEEKINGFVK